MEDEKCFQGFAARAAEGGRCSGSCNKARGYVRELRLPCAQVLGRGLGLVNCLLLEGDDWRDCAKPWFSLSHTAPSVQTSKMRFSNPFLHVHFICLFSNHQGLTPNEFF